MSTWWGLGSEEEGVVIAAPSSSADVDGAYALVLEASTKFVTIYDMRFNEVVRSHGKMAGEYLEGKVYRFCTDIPYKVRSRQNRAKSECDMFPHADLVEIVQFMEEVIREVLTDMCYDRNYNSGLGIMGCGRSQRGWKIRMTTKKRGLRGKKSFFSRWRGLQSGTLGQLGTTARTLACKDCTTCPCLK